MVRSLAKFNDAILRIRNIDALYIHLTSTLHFPDDNVTDLLRSEIVYVISAFDKLMHDIVRQGMLEIFAGSRLITPAYKNFSINLSQLESITNATTFPAPADIFEAIIIQSHSYLSFQDADKLTAALSLIWLETHKWQKIANCMVKTEQDVKTELKNIVIRRNQIVHEGDQDAFTGTLQNIRHSDTINSVNFIEQLANCIYNLI